MVKVSSTIFSSWTFCNLLLFGETQPCEQTQAQNATTKRYHKTLPLMGATRLEAAEKCPDARRGC